MSSSSLNDGDYYPQHAQSSQTAITAFLAKLWALVNDSSCDDLIAWDPSGGSFHVYDQSRFAREILPRYFKHNNFASFIRQLNMYGFRKISTIEHGSLKNERDDIEFAHQNFVRGQDNLLEYIKRRAPDNHQQKGHGQTTTTTTKIETSAPVISPTMPSVTIAGSNNINHNNNNNVNTNIDSKQGRPYELVSLLDDVQNLQTKQTALTDKLFHMEDENQALWREVGLLKQKHAKQQQIVSKLMEFLLHFLTNSTQTQRPSVEQASPNNSSQQIHSNPILNSAHSLKRKPAALMLGEQPKKRPNFQQPGIIINELPDNDTATWLHTTNASPLVDLVPSPPPISATSTIIPNPQSSTNYDWNVPTDELRNTMNYSSPQTMKSTNQETTNYIPDFFLTTNESDPSAKASIEKIDQSSLSGINTSLKEEQIDFPNASTLSTLHQSNSGIFSLDDVTGDVHHIQSSLDNIRDFMFDNLPHGTTIEDLFCDDPVLLSPLLQTNILNDNDQQQQQQQPSNSCRQIILHKTENTNPNKQVDVDNQFFENLINQTKE